MHSIIVGGAKRGVTYFRASLASKLPTATCPRTTSLLERGGRLHVAMSCDEDVVLSMGNDQIWSSYGI